MVTSDYVYVLFARKLVGDEPAIVVGVFTSADDAWSNVRCEDDGSGMYSVRAYKLNLGIEGWVACE